MHSPGNAGDDAYGMALANALCARLCHDLASPLGTLMGALELAGEDPDSIQDALPLATETATEMGARLKLMRAAWAGDCGPLSVDEIGELARGLPARVQVDLSKLRNGPFDGPVARALLNLLLLGAEALPRGGIVTLASGDADAILVTVKGRSATWPANLAQALLDPQAVSIDNPRAVQPPMAVMLAQAAGRRLSMAAAPTPDAEQPDALLLAIN